jgi:hypothetical protein
MKSLILFLVAVLLSSCASTYYDMRFAPPTTEAIATSTNGGQARSVLSYVGVRRADSHTGAPAQVEFRMRVENLGKVSCTLEQHALQLLSGALEPFGAAQLVSNDPPLIVAGGNATFEVLFPVPPNRRPEDMDMRSLNLRWAIGFDGETVTNGFTFEHILPDSYNSTNFSFGVGISNG